jgi:hypothetical protein
MKHIITRSSPSSLPTWPRLARLLRVRASRRASPARPGRACLVQVERPTGRTTWTRQARSGCLRCVMGSPGRGVGIPEQPGPGRVALAAGGWIRVVGPEALPAGGSLWLPTNGHWPTWVNRWACGRLVRDRGRYATEQRPQSDEGFILGCMSASLVLSVLTGGFALVGGLGGILLSGLLSRRHEQRRVASEDDRRWLADRRKIYASYLVLVGSMLKEIDGVGVFLSYDGTEPVPDKDEQLIKERLIDYFIRWDDELQPVLLEVELVATPQVADLAERVSDALMEITEGIERRRPFIDYHPGWFQTKDLFEVLKVAMRVELGLPETGIPRWPKTDPNWPWLPDRPPRESHRQHDCEQRSGMTHSTPLPKQAPRRIPKKRAAPPAKARRLTVRVAQRGPA